MSEDLKLQANENVIKTSSEVGYGGGMFNKRNDLILTNQSIILVKKGLLGKTKEVVRFPLSDIVISNNQTNTDWGKQTAASLDGRNSGVYMNPANNPQGGAALSGPTAVLNSLAKFRAKYHGGSVQNMRFTPRMMHDDEEKVRAMFRTYFEKGGCQLMVTVVDHGVLEDAKKHPENYPDLIVRVAGYSAIFVNLSPDVQDELISRALYD